MVKIYKRHIAKSISWRIVGTLDTFFLSYLLTGSFAFGLSISSDYNHIDGRFPVQNVIRPHKKGLEDYRAYIGKVESGVFKVGDKICVLPSGFSSTISKINIGEKEIVEAYRNSRYNN